MEHCNCMDCMDSETPCMLDCDFGHECQGCYEARHDQEEIEYEIKQAIGWRL